MVDELTRLIKLAEENRAQAITEKDTSKELYWYGIAVGLSYARELKRKEKTK